MSEQRVLGQLYKFIEIDRKLKEKELISKQVKKKEIADDELVLFLDIKSLKYDEQEIINEIGIELTEVNNKKILLNNGEELIFWNTAKENLDDFMQFKLGMYNHRNYNEYSSINENYYLLFYKEKEEILLNYDQDKNVILKLSFIGLS